MIYYISYDIEDGETRDYSNVSLAIESCGEAKRFQKSVWLLSSTKTAVQIRDVVKAVLNGSDTLFVARLDPQDWAGWRTKLQAWIQEHLAV